MDIEILVRSHELVRDLIQLRRTMVSGDAQRLIEYCDEALKYADGEAEEIVASRFRVNEKLDLLDKAKDRIRAVRVGAVDIANISA